MGHQSTLIAIRVLARELAISPKDHRIWKYSCNISATLQARDWGGNPGRCKPTGTSTNSFWHPDLAIQLYLTKQESILMSKVLNKTVVPLGSLKTRGWQSWRGRTVLHLGHPKPREEGTCLWVGKLWESPRHFICRAPRCHHQESFLLQEPHAGVLYNKINFQK